MTALSLTSATDAFMRAMRFARSWVFDPPLVEPQDPLALVTPITIVRGDGTQLTVTNAVELREALIAGDVNPQVLRSALEQELPYDRSFFHMLLDIDPRITGVTWMTRRRDDTYPYVPSSVKAVLAAIDFVPIHRDCVVYDVGAGFGMPTLLIGLLTGATVRGIEWESGYCEAGNAAARTFGLEKVDFICTDALQFDYADADVLFMYTPFFGPTLDKFLEQNVLPVARKKPIVIAFHGPNVYQLANKPWLQPLGINRICTFYSNPEIVAASERETATHS
jgi:SAM-dependent methyltransferase